MYQRMISPYSTSSRNSHPLGNAGVSPIAIRWEKRREISASINDAHDFNGCLPDAIEEDGRVDNDRSDAGDDLVARHARFRKFDQMGGSALDVPQVGVSCLRREMRCAPAPDR